MAEQRVDWGNFVPRIIHPTKVAIFEALSWLGRELSSVQMEKMFGDPKMHLTNISYHARALAEKGALVQVAERPVRGAVERFYYFPELDR